MLKSNTVNESSFLFLIDFSKESYRGLDYLIKLTKSIGGTIELLYISNLIDYGEESGPLSILDSIAKEKNQIKSKFKSIVEMIEVENVEVITSHIFGNFEIELELKTTKQNQTLVINKNQKGLMGKSSFFLLNSYKGNLLILSSNGPFMTGNSIAIGCDESSLKNCDLNLPARLSHASQIPIIILQSNQLEDVSIISSFKFPLKEEVEVYYKTINHKRMLDGFKEFINNTNVELLCICRNKANDSLLNRLIKSKKTTKEIVNSITTPLLIMGENK